MKFRIKIMLCMVAMMALLFGIGGSTLIMISFHESLEREQNTARNAYQLLIQTLQILNDVDTWADGKDASDSLENIMQRGTTIWSGCRLSSVETTYYNQGGKEDVFLNAGDQLDAEHYSISHVQDKSGHYMQLSGMFKIGEESLYLDVLYDVSSVYAMRIQQEAVFYRIFVVLLISCVILAYLLSILLTRSLTRLSKAANEIASGNLAYRSDIKSTDEIGNLSRDFDNMAQQVQQSVEKITQSMKQQEEFMGSFAHELKTPMTSVIGYADLMRSHDLSKEESVEAANYIFSEGKRLESLSLKLLAVFMADKQNLTFQMISPGKQISEFAEHLSPVYEEFNVQIGTDCEEGSCLLEPDLFQTLLVNLADNARKALDQGGLITLGCRMTEFGCRVWCKDNGRGIPEESLSHLTEAFYRVDKSRSRMQGGAGLGLTLCNKIAEIHNGYLEIESEEGNGTSVTVELRGGAE